MSLVRIKPIGGILLAITCALASHVGRAMPTPRPPSRTAEIHFASLDVFIDPAARPLAAYQIELIPRTGSDATIVGLAGGEHPVFKDPPFYDPAALNAPNSRLIIAAFTTAADVPAGRTRVTRIAFAYTGPRPPEFSSRLVTAATPEGDVLSGATVSLSQSPAAAAATTKGSL